MTDTTGNTPRDPAETDIYGRPDDEVDAASVADQSEQPMQSPPATQESAPAYRPSADQVGLPGSETGAAAPPTDAPGAPPAPPSGATTIPDAPDVPPESGLPTSPPATAHAAAAPPPPGDYQAPPPPPGADYQEQPPQPPPGADYQAPPPPGFDYHAPPPPGYQSQAAPPAAQGHGRRWVPLVIGGVVLVAVVAAALVLFVFSSSKDDDKQAAYEQQVSTAMAPVISANKKLSSALTSLHDTDSTLAQQRANEAQAATLTARGAINALDAPSGSEQRATNARGTLSREQAYLAAVAGALSDPASGSASQSQTLASNLTDALNAIAPADQDWAQSVSGADTLTAWAPKTAATLKRRADAKARKARRKASGNGNRSGSQGSSPTPSVSSGGTDCGGGLHAGPNTSCAFAANVKAAYDEAPGASASVQVFSPVTGQTYTMSCAPAGNGVTCSGGNNASVTWSY